MKKMDISMILATLLIALVTAVITYKIADYVKAQRAEIAAVRVQMALPPPVPEYRPQIWRDLPDQDRHVVDWKKPRSNPNIAFGPQTFVKWEQIRSSKGKQRQMGLHLPPPRMEFAGNGSAGCADLVYFEDGDTLWIEDADV